MKANISLIKSTDEKSDFIQCHEHYYEGKFSYTSCKIMIFDGNATFFLI